MKKFYDMLYLGGGGWDANPLYPKSEPKGRILFTMSAVDILKAETVNAIKVQLEHMENSRVKLVAFATDPDFPIEKKKLLPELYGELIELQMQERILLQQALSV